MDIKELLAQFDDMEAEDGMNITEEVNEAKIEDGSLGDVEVLLDKISTVGLVVRGNTFDSDISKEKSIDFSFVSKGMFARTFKAPLDNENDPKELAKECAEILRKHLEPAEDEILALLTEKGFSFNKPVEDTDNELV